MDPSFTPKCEDLYTHRLYCGRPDAIELYRGRPCPELELRSSGTVMQYLPVLMHLDDHVGLSQPRRQLVVLFVGHVSRNPTVYHHTIWHI